MDLKTHLVNSLEIAEINLLMSIKNLSHEDSMERISPNTNSIIEIFAHCSRQMDNYLFKHSSKHVMPQKQKTLELVSSGNTFGDFIDWYLEISNGFFMFINSVSPEDLEQPIGKGEKLHGIISRISLHFCGHMGQISIIRKAMLSEVEGPYTFIKAMSKPTRKKLRKEWDIWWKENRESL